MLLPAVIASAEGAKQSLSYYIGKCKLEIANWKLQIGKCKLESANWKVEIANWKVQIEKWKVQIGNFIFLIFIFQFFHTFFEKGLGVRELNKIVFSSFELIICVSSIAGKACLRYSESVTKVGP